MHRKFLCTLTSFLIVCACAAQKGKYTPATDTTFTDYDELFSELDALIDSLTAPRSFTLFNIGMSSNFFTYGTKSGSTTEAKRKLTYSPALGYYDKTGFGIGVGTSVVNDGTGMNPYQFSITGSYDFIQKKSFLTGISLSHYFTKKDLPFYTSPLQNEAYGYFTYRKLWFKPSMGVSYGWGSRNDLEEREEKIQNIQLAQNGFTRINTRESVIDLNLTASIRHDFYFLKLLSRNDYIRITPQLSFTSGTQQFGFNQTSNTYATVRRTGSNVLFSTENITLDNQLYFQPISLAALLKVEYSKGIFFMQPQLMVDYYFPAAKDNLTTLLVLNAGFVF
ncbi:MAG: hypothetical protein M3Y85_01870 [Bacteroidota bacterium]|nr:hypothetical protein [Bacteroidota bacterium]